MYIENQNSEETRKKLIQSTSGPGPCECTFFSDTSVRGTQSDPEGPSPRGGDTSPEGVCDGSGKSSVQGPHEWVTEVTDTRAV